MFISPGLGSKAFIKVALLFFGEAGMPLPSLRQAIRLEAGEAEIDNELLPLS